MLERIQNQLMAELSRRNIDLITHFTEENPQAIELLVQIVLSHKEPLAQRASWVLEKLSERNKGILSNYLPLLVENLQKIPSSSTRRTLAKVLMLHDIPEEYAGFILDFCITMIESPKEPVAVKANCMTIVFNLLPKYPDLKKEVCALIENQIPNNSVGFESRYKVLRKKIR